MPQESIETHRASWGDVAPGNAPSGLFAVCDLLRTGFVAPGSEGAAAAAGTVVVAIGFRKTLRTTPPGS